MTLTALMTTKQALSPRALAGAVPVEQLRRRLPQLAALAWTLNSFVYASLATLGLLVSSIPVAYALSRLRWRGRDTVFLVVLVALMLPPQVAVVPLYVMWAKLGLVGDLWPLIIPNWFGDAFAIFLLRQFFLTIPRSTSTLRASTAAASSASSPPSSSGSRSRRSRPWRSSPSSTPGTTSSCRCSTWARTRTTGWPRSGSRSSARCTRCSGT